MKIFDEENLEKILLGVIIFLLLVIIALLVFDYSCSDEESENNEVVALETKEVDDVEFKEESILVQNKIRVDIKGAIKKTGVYEVDSGARINDVIKLAGGLKSNASTKYLNLSKKVVDEMVIYVYTNNQIKNMENNSEVKEECICSSEDIKECEGASVIVPGDSGDSLTTGDVADTINKVSINNATKDELMTLSGIGESKALAIIEYRNQNGLFKSLEDIMNVSGIGEKAYSQIKDYIML